ncbi:MAG: hypothetical protein METHP_00967 [Methanoregula sp. SKADARSKE-2]|jgi:hypothetical protein|nr:MAG: hypothetical protein METHP_00967 [Methanoregula sp. SKADARSKE-2]
MLLGTMDHKKVEKIFLEEGIDREITCPQAFQIAERHKIAKGDISEYCNSHKIKIKACQLGCFK